MRASPKFEYEYNIDRYFIDLELLFVHQFKLNNLCLFGYFRLNNFLWNSNRYRCRTDDNLNLYFVSCRSYILSE